MPSACRVVAAFAALVVGVGGLGPTGAAQQADEPVRSARLILSRKPIKTVVVHLRNLRDVPIHTWAVQTENSRTWRTRVNSGYEPGDGPIAPREERAIPIDDPDGRQAVAAPVVRLAVFADGAVDGTPEGIAEELARQRSMKVEAEYWKTELASMPRDSNEALARFIEPRVWSSPVVAEHATSIADRLKSLTGDTSQRPSGWVIQVVDEYRREIEATAVRPPLKPVTSPSTSVRSEPGTTARIVGSIENMSSSSIMSFAIAVRNAAGQVSGGMSSSYVPPRGPGPAPRGDGPIQSGELREVHVVLNRDAPQAQWPVAFLEYVAFADGRVEGSRAAYEENRRRR